MPTGDFDEHDPDDYDFRPTSGSDLTDAGVFLPNINEPWDKGSTPTVGAFLYNETIEQIGCDF
jgi:hypothetical protein